MEIGVYKALPADAGALLQTSPSPWVGALVSDLRLQQATRLRPRTWNSSARISTTSSGRVAAMTIATIVSISAFYGLIGPTTKALVGVLRCSLLSSRRR